MQFPAGSSSHAAAVSCFLSTASFSHCTQPAGYSLCAA
jgi:hypothetical protein